MHISVPSVCLVPMQARIECESLRAVGTDDCEPPCRYWDVNLRSLEEEPVLFITEPSIQTLNPFYTGIRRLELKGHMQCLILLPKTHLK